MPTISVRYIVDDVASAIEFYTLSGIIEGWQFVTPTLAP